MPDIKKLILIDAYSLIYRAYYAFIKNPRINSKGLNTSAIFGFTNSLLDVINKEKPTHIAVAFDPPGPTFRHESFPEYKANRDATPEDILKSVPYIKEIIDALNIQRVEEYGFEADDVIGTLAGLAEKKDFDVVMYTPDKDYCQLVSERVHMLKPGRGGNEAEIITPEKVCETFNIDHPEKVTDVLGLWGDSSDNIPGAPGVGEKGAKKLVGEYGSIEGIYQNIEDLKGKLKENLINFKDQVELSKQLVTIKKDVPVEVDFDELSLNEPNESEISKIFEELEFRTLINRIIPKPAAEAKTDIQPEQNPDTFQGSLFDMTGQTAQATTNSQFKTITEVEVNYQLVDTNKKVNELINNLAKQLEFCFDTETTSLDVYTAELVGLSFCYKVNEAFYIPIGSDRNKAQELLDKFKPVFEQKNILKIGQNIKYDVQILRNYSIDVKGKWFDTMLAHYLLQPELRHNLDYLSEKYLKYKPIAIESLIGKKGKNQHTMRSVPAEQITNYACEDADLTFQLKQILHNELDQNILDDLFSKLEMPLTRVLIDMEEAGFKLDIDALNKYGEELRNELIKIENEILQLAGIEFNISSPKQLGEVLFEKLKIDSSAKTSKTKQYSTSEEVLLRLTDKHPIIEKILDFRSLKKLLSTYVEALPKLIHHKTNKIHTSFNQAVAATGRLSSANPNLQNIPIREERGREIRKSFIPSDNNVLLAADYSQIELRLMAHMSKDVNMLEAFNNNEDIHTATAAKINKVTLDAVTKEMRSKAKTANFGIIYGISSFGLSQRLHISRSDAKSLIDGYFSVYSGVKSYMDECIRLAREKGYVITLMGRKRVLSDINSRNATVRGFAERNAINAPIQGSAADIIKMAMINIHSKLIKGNYKSKMILQVHDELIFDVPHEEVEKLKVLVKTEMENVVKLNVPLTVDMGIGNNWLEAH
ncbi:DNA polymerase I [Bacteroidota bacterium]